MSQTIIYLLSILPLPHITSMTFCPQLALGTISLTSDWILGDNSKQDRCYIGKIVNKQNIACVQGSTNGTNGIPISFKVLPMVPLVIPLVPMVMPLVPLALPMVPLIPLVSQWYHWLPMVPLVKLPMVQLGEPRTEPLFGTEYLVQGLH